MTASILQLSIFGVIPFFNFPAKIKYKVIAI